MKFSALAVSVVALSSSATCDAFQSPLATTTRSKNTALQASKPEWWGPAATAVAGWTLASQIATASVMLAPPPLDYTSKDQPALAQEGTHDTMIYLLKRKHA